ncbi:acetyltransferase [Vibrio cholerae]|nr:acetyltransferase [Vibrio cholerae]
MVTAAVFEFCGVRYQPLRRALCVFLENGVSDEN